MMKALFIIGSSIVLYLILRPIVNWYQKAKKEMEEAERDDEPKQS